MPETVIVCLGDSISDGGSTHGVTNPFPRKLIDELGTTYRSYNFGIPSQTADHLHLHLQEEIYENMCDWLVVLLGVNDLGLGQLAVDVFAELEDLYKVGIGRGMKVCACTCLPSKNGVSWTPAYQTQLDILNGLILGASDPTVIVDLYPIMEDASPDELEATYDSGDGVHPNQAGHDVLTTTIAAALSSYQVTVDDKSVKDLWISGRYSLFLNKFTGTVYTNRAKAEGDNVQNMMDLSANEMELTEATNNPTLTSHQTDSNGNTTVSFDGTQLLTGSNSIALDRTTAFSIMMVIKFGSSGIQTLFSKHDGSTGYEFRYDAAGPTLIWEMTNTATTNSLIVEYSVTLSDTFHLVEIHSDGLINGAGGDSHLTCIVDGSTLFGTASADTLTGSIINTENFTLGATPGSPPTNYFSGDFGDLVVDTGLTAGEKITLQSVIADYWGITVDEESSSSVSSSSVSSRSSSSSISSSSSLSSGSSSSSRSSLSSSFSSQSSRSSFSSSLSSVSSSSSDGRFDFPESVLISDP